MKKLAVILSTAFLLGSTLCSAKTLICLSSGQAYMYDNGHWTTAGGCAGGPWKIDLRTVAPTGNPNVAEASDELYSALNAMHADPSVQPSEDEIAELQAHMDEGGISEVWVNPLKLNEAAYALVYDGTTDLPLFYANTAFDSSTGDNYLSLYSDADRDISVTYKTLDLMELSSENITVARGYNSRNLNTASLANGTYIVTISTNEGYEVNLTLAVYH